MLGSGGDDEDVQRDLHDDVCFSIFFSRHRTPRGLKTAPRPPHMASQGGISERTGPNAKLGEGGTSKGTLPGTACSVSGEGADARGGDEFLTFSEAFPSRDFVVCPLCGVSIYGRRSFAGDGSLSSARGYFFIPGDFC